MRELVALLDGTEVGRIARGSGGRLRLTYDDEWRESPRAYPLSLSMPLARREHEDAPVRAFLDGLLPDNLVVLERWARRFRVSARNPFALLAHVGADCAGAVQLVPPERVEEVLRRPGRVEWLDEDEVAERLNRLRLDPSAVREPDDTGAFSLTGAQAKTALFFEDGRWGVPSGPTPTTHILKPPLADFGGFVENEHLTLRLAEACGIPSARSRVHRFGDVPVLVVERFDRTRDADGTWRRLHQEDLCQALGVPTLNKYEADGGPGAAQVFALLRERTSEPWVAVPRMLELLLFNWLAAVTDGHAKNYSLHLGPEGRASLTPAYDIASAAPYPLQLPRQRQKLAMKLGGEYRVEWIRARHVERMGAEAGVEEGFAADRALALADRIAEGLGSVRDQAVDEGVDAEFAAAWHDAVAGHVERCGRVLSAGGMSQRRDRSVSDPEV